MVRLCCLFVLSALSYFCDVSGTVLEYERTYVDSGKLKWKHVMEIGESRAEDDALTLDYSSTFRGPSGSVMYGGPVALVAKLHEGGDVEMDLSRSLASVFTNYVGERAVSFEPCFSLLPADMEPGERLEDAHFEVTVLGLKYKVSVTEREVLRRESIKTAAGDFDCVVVREHKVEKGPGRNRETTALTWYAKGVGMVRHDTYDRKGVLETSEVLVSMKR